MSTLIKILKITGVVLLMILSVGLLLDLLMLIGINERLDAIFVGGLFLAFFGPLAVIYKRTSGFDTLI